MVIIQEGHLKSQPLRADAVATRARLVAAAERLFAERGIDSVSSSQINRTAGQRNRSALQYHFGSRAGLIHAIFDKHTAGIERRRHAMIDEIEAKATLGLRPLVQALVAPVAEKLDDPDGGVAFVRLNAQLIGHPGFPLLTLAAERVNRDADRLQRLTARACPQLPQRLWVPRWLLVIGLLFHGIADYARLAENREGALAIPSRDVFVNNLVDAIVAVLEAPVSEATLAVLDTEP